MIVLLNEDTDVIVVRSPRNNCSEKSSFSGRNKNGGGVHSANGLFTLPNVLFLKVYFKVCHLWMITTFLIVGHH